MEGGLYLAAAALSGFCLAALVGRAVFENVRFAYLSSSATSMNHGAAESSDIARISGLLVRYYMRNGIVFCEGIGRVLARIPRLGSFFEDASSLLERRGLAATPKGLASVVVVSCGVSALASLVVFRSVATALLVPLCLLFVFVIAVVRGHAREQELLRDQIPDALRCMEACLHAGLSLPQAFAEVSKEVHAPAKEVFARVSRDLELGFSMEQSLARFRKSAAVAELAFVAMALDVQYVCGGDATPVLRSAEESVMRSLELKRSLRVQTAQSRFSAQIVSAMPVFLLTVLSVLSPGFLNPFFENEAGFFLLACAAAMQTAGVLLVKKALSVEV